MVAGQLMSDALFSGWGVRTLSTDDAGFNPIGYHLGTVWPHDNSFIAHGLARYGFRDEANRIALALLERVSVLRLPVAGGVLGLPAIARPLPDAVPDGVQPAGVGDRDAAPASASDARPRRTRRGADPRSGLPDEIGRVSITGLGAFGTRWDVEAIGRSGHVRLARQG